MAEINEKESNSPMFPPPCRASSEKAITITYANNTAEFMPNLSPDFPDLRVCR
jgi:hypothetical protein